MIYQTFSRYYQLSLDEKVPPILCPNSPEHGILVPKMDHEDNILMYCLECTYVKRPGLKFYQTLLDELHKNNPYTGGE